jgi:hypothetical protein
VSASAVIHTDDIAWHHSRFGWGELLARSVLQPIRTGQPVGYRPPGWESHGRTGAIEVPTGLDLVIIEAVGAGRRGIARDVASGVNGDRVAAAAFWHSWMAEELRFLEHQRPWERAAVIVAGTPLLAHSDHQVVLALPPGGHKTSSTPSA